MKRNLLIILITAAALILIPISRAADQTITCTDSGCSGISDALFNESSVAPGESVTKSLEIINNHSQTLKLALSPSKNTGTDDDLIESVSVTVTTDKGNRFTGTLGQFLTAYIDLEKLESGQHRPVSISLSLADVGNDFQGKQAKFSFDLKIDQEVPGDSGGTGGTAASPSPSPAGVVAGVFTAVQNQVLGEETAAEEIVGVSPSPSPAVGVVAGQATSPWWWLLLLLFPLPLFWYWRLRRMS